MRTNFSYYSFAKQKLDRAHTPIKPSDLCSEAMGLGAKGGSDKVRKQLRETFSGLANTTSYRRVKVIGQTGYFYQSCADLLKKQPEQQCVYR